jgi:hypothetical protein
MVSVHSRLDVRVGHPHLRCVHKYFENRVWSWELITKQKDLAVVVRLHSRSQVITTLMEELFEYVVYMDTSESFRRELLRYIFLIRRSLRGQHWRAS